MKSLSEVYRDHAAREAEFAAGASLEHIRALHARSAKKWLELADRAELIENRSSKR